MDKSVFSQLLYETHFNSTATVDDAIQHLSPLRNWLKDNVPKKLFRYRRNTDYNVNSIYNDEIWGSTILECNDPYECTPCYDVEKFKMLLRQMFSSETLHTALALLKETNTQPALKKFFHPDVFATLTQALETHSEETVISELMSSCLSTLDRIEADWQTIIDHFFAGIRLAESKTHIACFSECCDSSLMWGHYADSHRGFCLEYDFRAVLQDCPMSCADPSLCNSFMLNFPVAPVTYSDHRFDATSYLPSVIQAHLQGLSNEPVEIVLWDVLLLLKCQLQKSSDWAYEQEWRLTRRSHTDTYVPHKCIAKLKPTGVYLGALMPISEKTKIYQICQQRDISCYIMLQNYAGQDYSLQAYPYEEFLKVCDS